MLSEADYARGRLAGAAGRLVNPYLIGQPLLRREAILSGRIEGTFTTPEQLVLLEAGVPPAGQDARASADTAPDADQAHHGCRSTRTATAGVDRPHPKGPFPCACCGDEQVAMVPTLTRERDRQDVCCVRAEPIFW